jgi:hypothetical protein
MGKKSKAFKTVDKIAHAFKHVVASGNPANSNLRAKEVISISGAFDPAVFDVSTFDVGFVTLKSDPTINVLTVVREAAAFALEQCVR